MITIWDRSSALNRNSRHHPSRFAVPATIGEITIVRSGILHRYPVFLRSLADVQRRLTYAVVAKEAVSLGTVRFVHRNASTARTTRSASITLDSASSRDALRVIVWSHS